MRHLRLSLACFVLLALAFAVVSASASTGTLTLTASTVLTEDQHGSVVIAADDVTLNCAGHHVFGSGAVESWGVTIDGRTGVTIENCIVSGFERGIVLSAADHNRIVGNTATGNEQGFYLWPSSDDNTLVGNIGSGNSRSGFFVHGSEGNVLKGNVANDNAPGEGFGLGHGGGANLLTGNTARGNVHGFYLAETSDNVLQGNTASSGDVGIQINGGGSGNVLAGNTISDNDIGINLAFGAHGTIVKGNTAVGSGHAGFALVGTDVASNALTGNIARANTVNGFLLTDGAHDNTLIGNKAESNGDGDRDGADYTDAGFFVWEGSANAFTGNTASNNDGPGFYIMGSHNALDANTATGNFMWGFMVYGNGVPGYTSGNVLRKNVATENNDGFLVWDGATATVLDRNIANNNTVTGFAAWNVSGNSWTRNTAKGNATYGFILGTWGAFCSGNLLDSNVGARNGVLDAYDMNTEGLNTWSNNAFGTSSPLGL